MSPSGWSQFFEHAEDALAMSARNDLVTLFHVGFAKHCDRAGFRCGLQSKDCCHAHLERADERYTENIGNLIL